jgi:hypothetical protein
MEAITELEKCWFLSPPWGQEIPPVEINLWERVYFKANRRFGYCCGLQWYRQRWDYVIDVENDIIRATKHEILGTGRIEPTTVKKPAFVLGDCLRHCAGAQSRTVAISQSRHKPKVNSGG